MLRFTRRLARSRPAAGTPAAHAGSTEPRTPPAPAHTPPLHPGSRILALVPHYRCEQWLGHCLESLLGQTRPPDGVVVVDDASGDPPVDIVRRYPQVTLLASPENAGPYALVQRVIELTDFDGYMFQDADDWSDRARLATELAFAAEHGAELVGSWYCLVHTSAAAAAVRYFPRDVNAMLQQRPTFHALQHPSSIVARDLVLRLGGFATGMRFSGDTEFLRRAVYAARIRNVQQVLYYRRDREGALTRDPSTGLESPARLAVRKELARRAKANREAVAGGGEPDLTPLRTRPPLDLAHVCGPGIAADSLLEVAT